MNIKVFTDAAYKREFPDFLGWEVRYDHTAPHESAYRDLRLPDGEWTQMRVGIDWWLRSYEELPRGSFVFVNEED